MKSSLLIAVLLFTVQSLVAEDKPNLTGVWKNGNSSFKFDHKEPKLHVVHDIEDQNGKRTLEFDLVIDGKEHKIKLLDLPATVMGKWEGEDFIFVIKRDTLTGVPMHNHRVMKIDKDATAITAVKTGYNPDGTVRAKINETWKRE